MNNQIITSLFSWYKTHGRHTLPWRQTKDPYKILVSELMLQQTQVPRVIPKYNAFIARFPTMKALSKADRTEVLKLWQGLGYNSRAVRLQALAKLVQEKYGQLPRSREALLKLPGIGPYTAGAVTIFAYNEAASSVDVNIERVLKRVYWSPKHIPAKKDVESLALQLIQESGQPHHWQCALMDLGSAICTARNPKCKECPLFSQCRTRGVRPEESRIPKQSKFHGSTRWWRGQILRMLLVHPVYSQHLMYKIKERPDADDEEKFNVALAAMIKEGIVEKRGKELRVV